MAKVPTYNFKAGDDFVLPITVTNKTSAEAVAAELVVIQAQADYDEAIAANPQVPLDISDAETALGVAKDAYALAIIVDITDWTMTSSIKWCGRLISELVVTKTDAAIGKFEVTAAYTVTELWKPRLCEADIQFIVDGIRTSSSTFHINVVRDVTNE